MATWPELGQMDDLGRGQTPLHRLDARAKAIATGVFICAVMSFPRYEVSALTPFALYPVALATLARIPARPLLRKILAALPFALAVSILNPLLDRQPVAAGPFAVAGGWVSLTAILLKFALTAGAALVLAACTGMYRLGAGLERLGLPRVFVGQLLFLHRYVFVVAEEGAKLKRGVELRSAGLRTLRPRVYGSLVGNLLLRAVDRARRIHLAMVLRGFDGELRSLRSTSWGWRESVFVVGWSAYFVAARAWNLAEWLGRQVTGS